jgi:hypothetical protein
VGKSYQGKAVSKMLVTIAQRELLKLCSGMTAKSGTVGNIVRQRTEMLVIFLKNCLQNKRSAWHNEVA